MNAQHRAWEAALVLTEQHQDSLTPQQYILCLTTTLAHPDKAPLELIALASQILGERK